MKAPALIPFSVLIGVADQVPQEVLRLHLPLRIEVAPDRTGSFRVTIDTSQVVPVIDEALRKHFADALIIADTADGGDPS